MEELKKLFIELGYNVEEFNKILDYDGIKEYKTDTLARKVKVIFSHLLSLGYTQEQVIKMTTRGPAVYALSIENINNTIKDIQKEFGYTKQEIIKMTVLLPTILSLTVDNMKQKIEDMEKLGFKKSKVIKYAKSIPNVYGIGIDTIEQKLIDIMNLGYTEAEAIKITQNNLSILGFDIEHLQQKMKDVQELGYTYDEVMEILKKYPTIVNHDLEIMKLRQENVENFGYTDEETKKMIKSFPAILGYDAETMSRRIDFWHSINLPQVPTIDPRSALQQSPQLNYARYKFFLVKGVEINDINYKKILCSKEDFEKKYGITTEELLEMFPYEERENTEPDEEKNKKIKARIDELEVLMHKKSTVEDVLEQLEKIVKYSSDIKTSDIKGTDTIKTLLERQNIEIDEKRLQEVGLEPDYPIGNRLNLVKKSYREGSSDVRATEEQAELFGEKYGIILARRTMTQKFISVLEKLQSCGVDTSKITKSDTIESLIMKTKGKVDLEKIRELFDLDEKIGQTYDNVRYAYGEKSKSKGIPATEEEARIILEKFGISIEKKDYFKEAETILQLLQSCGVDTSLLRPADKVESIIKRSKKKTRRDVDIAKIEESTDLGIGIGKRVYTLICADNENGKIPPLTEEQKKILVEQYGIKMEKKKIKSVSHAKATYTKESETGTEEIDVEIERLKKRAKELRPVSQNQEQESDTAEQQPIVSQTPTKAQPTNIDDLSDEELDKFIEEMDARQKEKEQRIERLKKIKRAKELITLSKQQDREISELESQIQKEGMEFNE